MSIFATKAQTGAQQIRGTGDLGALSLVHDTHVVVTTGASTATLANGCCSGQSKTVIMSVDGGDFVLTPASFLNGTTVTFDDLGDSITLVWTGAAWASVGATATIA
jgi:L-aminopeptidase/D-esterase-like protein